MAHKIHAYSKVQKVKEEPKFKVTNRKERRRLKSKKKGETQQVFKHGRLQLWYS